MFTITIIDNTYHTYIYFTEKSRRNVEWKTPSIVLLYDVIYVMTYIQTVYKNDTVTQSANETNK